VDAACREVPKDSATARYSAKFWVERVRFVIR